MKKSEQLRRVLGEWQSYRGLWRLRLKRGEVFIFSDRSSTMLTYVVNWGRRKKFTLEQEARSSGFIIINKDGVQQSLTTVDRIQIIAHDSYSQENRRRIVSIILASEPADPISGESVLVEAQIDCDLSIRLE